MKTLYSILLSLLLVAMAAVGVYSLVDVDATTSKAENRSADMSRDQEEGRKTDEREGS